MRSTNSTIIFARRYLSDETSAALARDGHKPQTVEQRRAELEAMLLGRPTFGHSAIVGIVRIPYKTPGFNGAISGVCISYRLYEVFGERQAHLFGLQMEGFMDPTLKLGDKKQLPAAGGMFTGVYMRSFQFDDMRLPVIRVGVNAGGFLGGTIGNSALAGLLLEVKMRYRLAAHAGLFYVAPVSVDELNGRLGGLAFRVGGSFNWE